MEVLFILGRTRGSSLCPTPCAKEARNRLSVERERTMGNRKKKVKTAYDDSLPRIFVRSGFDMLVIMLMTCVLLGLIAFFCDRLDSDGIQLMLFCLAMVLPFSYGLPVLSLFSVWRQERILGIYWKDRSDNDRPEWERDWYLSYDRGGFILCHRAYIKRIIGSQEKVEIGSFDSGTVQCLRFEDISGKKHTVKFSSSDGEQNFRRWYEKRPSGDQ